MKKIAFALFLLISPAIAANYEFSLSKISDEELSWRLWNIDPIPPEITGYDITVGVPWGRINLILFYDHTSPEEVTISGTTDSIAQGFRFYAVDEPNSTNRIQIASNNGEGELNMNFTMTSGSSQFFTFESENDPPGWVEIGYDSEKGLQIISQHELLAPPPPKITIRDGYVHITLASYSIFSVIEQSTDMKNWEAIAWDEYARVPLADNPGPLYFRERCP